MAGRDLSDELGYSAANQPSGRDLSSELYPKQEKTFTQGMLDTAGNLVAGGVRGAGSIGSTVLWPYDKTMDLISGDRGPNITGLVTGKQPVSRNQERRAAIDAGLKELGADPESYAYKGAKLGTEVLGTAPVGGMLGNLAAKAAPNVPILANALSSGGFNLGEAGKVGTGVLPWLRNTAARAIGGAVTGGVSSGLIDPSQALEGAAIGGALPGGAIAAAKLGSGAGRLAKAIYQPWTEKGQTAIAEQLMKKAAGGSPVNLNMQELVPGSMPTLAEASGNAGLARMQSLMRDVSPQQFIEREAQNANARSALFDTLSGSKQALDAARETRSKIAGDLYDQAAAKGIDPAKMTQPVLAELGDLAKRPAYQDAVEKAKIMAKNAGININADGSLQGLHYTRRALGDQISDAIGRGNKEEAKILQSVKDKLDNVIDAVNPEYAAARSEFARMSQPVNQMEVLQGLNLTNAKGEMTLSKVQSAIDGLERKMAQPGIKAEKSLTQDQLGTLAKIRDDLLRQTNQDLGRSRGSNTYQNIATNNILESALPFGLGELAVNKVGPIVGQVGKLMYSGPNEAIKGKLAAMALDPQLAAPAFAQAAPKGLLDVNRYAGLLNNVGSMQPVLAQGLLARFNGQ